MQLRVWAPRAHAVDLVGRGRRWPMTAEDRGWFTVDTELTWGDDYAFSLDGGPPRPDPRSRYQPHGVHRASRLVDPTSFSRSDDAWSGLDLHTSVIYELHVGTFTPAGTFDGAISGLDHVVELGVDMVEIMPVAAFPGERGWGYDGVGLWAVHRAYGGPAGLARFVDACHSRGLGVILDVVYNHLGPDGNYLEEFGPYLSDTHVTPWGRGINVDGPDSDEVRDFIVDNALTWLRDYRIDGLRLDAVHALVDTSATHILESLAAAVDDLEAASGRKLWLIAETDRNDPRTVWPRAAHGYGIDAQWSDDFHHALWGWLSGEHDGYYADYSGVRDVATALTSGVVYSGQYSRHRRRRVGRPHRDVSPRSLVVCLQNHDQVGNRARGDRAATVLTPGRLLIGASLVILSPFVPLLFAGEEWAATTPFLYFTDHTDPELAAAVTKGRREEFASFGWPGDAVADPQALPTLAASVLAWNDAASAWGSSVLAAYRRLIGIRRDIGPLASGSLDDLIVRSHEQGWICAEGPTLSIAASTHTETVEIPIGVGGPVLFGYGTAVDRVGESVRVPEDGVVVWRRR